MYREHTHILFRLVVAVFLVFASLAEARFIFEEDVSIPMRDGTNLSANIARPKEEGQYPVVLMRTPYGKPDKKNGDMKRYAEAGYVMVVQDCRGRGDSEGAWDPFAYDVQDGLDTQAWVGKQPWCNGHIGTAGGSYVGWTQWASAPGASPMLTCAVPVVPFAETFPDLAYYGGAFQLALLMGWGTAVGGVDLQPDPLQAAFRHLPLQTYGDQFEKPIPYLNDWVKHPTYDDYWKQRGIDGRYDEVRIPILNIGGWYDIFSKPVIDTVTQVREKSDSPVARENQRVIVGPWTHGVGRQEVGDLDFGPEARRDIGDLQFQWFEYWLKNQETGVQDWPAYQLFIMGENRWRGEQEWPLARTRYTPMYLRGGGKANGSGGDGALSLEHAGEEPADVFTYDPANPVPTTGGNNLVGAKAGPYDQSEVEKRNDVLVYTGTALAEDLEVTGPVKMVLYAASTAPDTDFTAKLVDVHPDGRAFNLCDGIIRARCRKGGNAAEPLVPGAVEQYAIDLWVTSNLFKAGHSVRVEVSSSNFPRFDRNPNSGLPFGTDTELHTADQTVYHTAQYPSHILLPVIPR